MAKYKVEDIRNIALVGHERQERLRWRMHSCSRPRRWTAGAAWKMARASPTMTTRRRRTNTRSTPACCTSRPGQKSQLARCSGQAGIRRAGAGGSERGRYGSHRRFGSERRPGQHPAHVCRGRQARAWPGCWSSTKLTATTSSFGELLAAISETFGKAACFSTRPIGVGASFSGVVSVLNPPDKLRQVAPSISRERARS